MDPTTKLTGMDEYWLIFAKKKRFLLKNIYKGNKRKWNTAGEATIEIGTVC